MGLLRHATSARRSYLEPDHLIGRAPESCLFIDEDYISRRHAVIRWVDDRWEVLDLGSRNRTYLNGEVLVPSVARPLCRGITLSFGHPDQLWRVEDDDPPRLMAVPRDGGEPVWADGELLVIPSPSEPAASIYADSRGVWVMESLDAVRPVNHEERIDILGRGYRLCIPHVIQRTSAMDVFGPLRLRDVKLTFLISRDEEHIRLGAELKDRNVDLGRRSHNLLLLVLARRRLEDVTEGFAPADQGWMYQDEVLKALNIDAQQLNTDVHRVRRHVTPIGVVDPVNIIERRTGQLRIGTSLLKVQEDA